MKFKKSLPFIGCLLFMLAFALSCSKKSSDQPSSIKSAAKAILSFSITAFTPAINAAITESTHEVGIQVPANTDISKLTPSISVSEKATITPASGVMQDFSQPVIYTVKAEDGSTQVYKVTVTIAPAVSQAIDCNNLPAKLTDRGTGVDYSVGCPINLNNGQVLTVAPGVTIQFDGVTAGITVTGGAALKMVGTAANPIVLQGKTAKPASWVGVQIDSQNIDNTWNYVTLQHAGAGSNAAGLLIADNAYFLHNTQMSITNCTFSDNNGYGIWDVDNKFNYARTVFANFSNNTFTRNSNAPICATIDAIGKLDAKSTYTGNTNDYIEVHGYFGLHNNTVVQKLNVPYIVVGSIGLHQRFTVSPGVTFQFYTDAGFNLDAQSMGRGTFIANGTSSAPIKFIGYQSGKGVWLGLSLGNNDPEIALDYCIIDGAGSNKPNTSTGCISDVKAGLNFYPSCNSITNKPLATHCTITNSGGYGIVYAKNAIVNFAGNSYAGNTLANVQAF